MKMVRDTWTGSEEDRARVNSILDEFEGQDPMESLIPALHKIQAAYRYIPEEAGHIISERWHIPETDIFNVVSFYSDFSTEPRGKRVLWICEGAACYFMGGPQLGEVAQSVLGIPYNETTPDGEWTLRRADFCFGVCHRAPLVELDHHIYGPLSPEELRALIANPPEHSVEEDHE
ncbi:NADH dehydrogenase (ubiquinone) 24 kDa subunit [Thermobaculum terrenum ATCC BAA-798]|uniref:NADH dehydrogenase (Ubiquinone) 24 kDa subunit n=2 Tax=Thermobaculum TaxID=262406 RepID=D1CCD1_THET1|nr:NADH dehydrogenase (ubiquinone) 24 kDa subunit [Thermobaculum terrenum ATCC BAA-798]